MSITKIDNNALAKEIYKQNLELLDQRRRVEQLIDTVAEGVFAVDENFNLTLFNSTLEDMLGKKSEDVLGEKANSVIAMATEDGKKLTVESYCFNANNNNHFEGVKFGRESKFYVNVKSSIVSPTRDKQECLVTVVDVTKERELDNTKDEFISITSHELRTPMTIIKSYLWMLQAGKGGKLSDKQEGYIQKALRGTERMLALINDMLNISKIEQGKVMINPEKITTDELEQEYITDLVFKTEQQGLTFNVEKTNNVKFIYADKIKFQEILTNLIGNSLKFTKKGGITLKINSENGDFAKISVIDTGNGISSEDQTRLFHKFGRLDNSYQTVAEAGGTGLGLYIVKQYVTRMGGDIGVYSEGEGKGSTFWFTLPMHKPKTL